MPLARRAPLGIGLEEEVVLGVDDVRRLVLVGQGLLVDAEGDGRHPQGACWPRGRAGEPAGGRRSLGADMCSLGEKKLTAVNTSRTVSRINDTWGGR